MTTIGDTDIKLADEGKTLEVISKAAHEGVMVRVFGNHAITVARIDLTADEALDLAQALILAATTSQRFRKGIDKLNTPVAPAEAPVEAVEADWTCPDCGRGVNAATEADLDWQVDNHVSTCVGVPGVTSDRVTVIQAIDEFLDFINNHPSIPEFYEYTADAPGKKFTRIVMSAHGGGRSVHCFIDNFTGDVFKAAGWKAPAKGARGNIVHGMPNVQARWDWSGHWLYLR